MSDTTKQMIESFRLKLLEYDKAPYDDLNIVILFNDAYRWAYNHYVKSNSTLFAQKHPINVLSGRNEYDMPENLWGKRIKQVVIPAPPNEFNNPLAYTTLTKVDHRDFFRWRSNKLKVLYPEVWSTLNNKIYIGPSPLIGFPMELIIDRRLIPLGVLSGTVDEVDDGAYTLQLNELNDDRLKANENDLHKGYLSISNQNTGEIKAVYKYSAVDTATNTVTLEAPDAARAKLLDYPISNPVTTPISSIVTQDDCVCYGLATAVSLLGDAFSSLVVDWSYMRARGSLNESDQEAVNALKEEIKDLHGDTGGRAMGISIKRAQNTQITDRPSRGRVQ
jgi:hypothetical protein